VADDRGQRDCPPGRQRRICGPVASARVQPPRR
jgi:hypothetical protein